MYAHIHQPLCLLTDIHIPTQPQESIVVPLSTGLGGTVLFFVVAITITVVILIKTRKNILSQKVNTQHYTKPPAGNMCIHFDIIN